MRLIAIALKDVLITLKDKKAMVMIILFPILLILVLGTCLSSSFISNGIKSFEIGVVDKDGGDAAKQFKSFLETNDVKKLISYKEMTEAEGLDKIKKGEIPALIILPESYSQAVKDNKPTNLQMYEDPGSSLKSKIAESIVKSYTTSLSSVQTAVTAANSVLKTYNIDPHIILPEVMKSSENKNSSAVKESDISGKAIVSAIQYYSAAMLVMFIMFVGMIGTSSIIEEREDKTLMRLMGTTVGNKTIILGKLLGLFLLGVLDVTVLIFFTAIVFKVNWGNSIIGLIAISAAMIFAACGFSIFLATIFKTSKAADSTTPVLVMIISFLGGSMFPIYGMPEAMQNISRLTFNNWALRGYIDLMLNNGLAAVTTPIVVLLGFGIVFLSIGISRLRLN